MSNIDLSKIDISELTSSLSSEELRTVRSVLSELSSKDDSSLLDAIWAEDYDEIPVDIHTFITDKRYLGNSFMTEDNHCLIYNYWIKVLEELFSPTSQIMECCLSGAIGIGKSTIADIGLAYTIYKLLCLKNPAQYYRLVKGSNIAIALFNISKDQGYGVGYDKLQNMMKQSPWFLEHGRLIGRTHPTYYPDKNIDIIVGSKMDHFIGHDIISAFMDEINFTNGASMKDDAVKVLKLYNTIKRRMESRYMKLGKLPGMLFMVSSKKSESDFLETYINENRSKPYVYVVDEPLWVVKADQGNYSGKTFKVAVGNTYLKSKILDDNEDPAPYIANGQEVINVPVEHREAFELDINSALMDVAGKALSSSIKYIYYDKLKLCYRQYLTNPFTMDEITLGFDDDTELQDYFIPSKLSKLDIGKPHFIHWDASKSGDCTGLAMTTIAGTSEVKKLHNGEVYQDEDIIHKLEFAIAISAEPGSEIPFYKIRNFIYYLKFNLNYNIVSVTCDSFQSVDTLQQLKLKGFDTKTISMDRSRVPYDTLKNAINEGRLIMPKIPKLEKELIELNDDKLLGKIDHPVGGCLTPYTKILTSNGPKYIKDLVEGQDKVYAVNNNNIVVETDFCNLRVTKKVDEIYEIKTEDGSVIRCTGNHPILAVREGVTKYIKAEELLDSDEVISIIDNKDLSSYSNKDKREYLRSSELVKNLYLNYYYSTREIATLFNVNFNQVKRALSYNGLLRNRSESNKIAIKKHSEDMITSSSSEKEFKEFLISNNIRFIHQFKDNFINHYFDFYLIDFNLLVEIDGFRHNIDHDRYLTNKAIDAGYHIIRLDENLCYNYGINLYKSLFIDLNYLNYIDGNKVNNLDIELDKIDRRTYRYGIPSYRGSKLSDHWKYRNDLDYYSVMEYIGVDRSHTVSEIYNKFKISRNCLKRIVRQFYKDEPNFDSFLARYTSTYKKVTWKVRKYVSDYIDSGVIKKLDTDIITKLEFLSYAKTHDLRTISDICSYFKRSENYCKEWFSNIMEMSIYEYLDSQED